ncbi:MAG TPA: DUF5131 family protein [Chloroflexota bacterium]
MHPNWARSLRDQCQEAGVPYFFKQWGEYVPAQEGCLVASHDAAVAVTHDRRFVFPSPYGGSEEQDSGSGQQVFRVGKRLAGRLLDGREWNQFPETGSSVP